MNGMVLLLALAAPGIDYGWRPGADGQLEYIVQLEPELIEALHNGHEIRSDIHPQARNMRRVVLRQGRGQLPRVTGESTRVARLNHATSSNYSDPDPGPHVRSDPPVRIQSGRPTGLSDALPPGVETGWRPRSDGQLEFTVQVDEVALDYLQRDQEIVSEIDPEIPSVARLVVRFGRGAIPRVGVVMAAGSDRREPAATANIVRTQGPVAPSGRSQAGSSGLPTARRPASTATNSSSTPPANAGSSERAGTGQGMSSTSSQASSGNAAPRQDSRDNSTGSSATRSATSPWTGGAGGTGTILGPAATREGADSSADRGTTAGSGERSGSQAGLLQAPPTDGYRYSFDDGQDEDDQWTTARGIDGGWQPQGPAERELEYDWRYDPELYSRAGDHRQPRPSELYDPHADRYAHPDSRRPPRYDRRDVENSYESERYASAGAPVPRDRIARASAEVPSERELALQRDLALARQKELERELEERDRVLAGITARTIRRADPEKSPSSVSTTTTASRESDSEARPTGGEQTGAGRSDTSGDLLKQLILFASLGMNIVAVLIAQQYYMRYRMLIREMRDPRSMDD